MYMHVHTYKLIMVGSHIITFTLVHSYVRMYNILSLGRSYEFPHQLYLMYDYMYSEYKSINDVPYSANIFAHHCALLLKELYTETLQCDESNIKNVYTYIYTVYAWLCT